MRKIPNGTKSCASALIIFEKEIFKIGNKNVTRGALLLRFIVLQKENCANQDILLRCLVYPEGHFLLTYNQGKNLSFTLFKYFSIFILTFEIFYKNISWSNI